MFQPPTGSSTTLSAADLVRIEANRHAAKARIDQARPTVESLEAAPGADKPSSMARKRKAIDLTYCEFDLSTMKDTRGGFLYQEQAVDPKKQKQVERTPIYEPPIDLILENNPQCQECKSIDVDLRYYAHFKVKVCKACKDKEELANKYSLLTKTEARTDYLLTDSELKDSEHLPTWEKPNPHKSTYSNMLLYLRCHLEAFAWKKWGGEEGLDAEFQRREDEKKERKEKKYLAKVSAPQENEDKYLES
ncbi:hypothetical protein HKX48_003473 [Thoreauomyces humboldtii]|nr:hypothetical protein HKX48_003473 [Thoreauomyces humboldtii]